MAPTKDPFAEFKGKQKLTEREVNLLLRRLNSGMIKASQLRRGGYALTPDQVRKGREWLMNLWVTPTGAERKNNPFGYREEAILETFKTIRLADVVDTSLYRATRRFYVPVYEVVGKDDSFMYYLSGGKINIVG
jgi:hypothetical protein